MGRENRVARRKAKKKGRRRVATRKSDLRHIAQRREQIISVQGKLQVEWNAENQVFTERVNALLRGAGILDAVARVNEERKTRVGEVNEQLIQLNEELKALAGAEQFLRERQEADGVPTPPPEPPTQDNGNKPLGTAPLASAPAAEPVVEPRQEVEHSDLPSVPVGGEE